MSRRVVHVADTKICIFVYTVVARRILPDEFVSNGFIFCLHEDTRGGYA